MQENTYICDCGHPESPHSEFTRGYGRDENGKTSCYACCAEADRAYMREHGKITLYYAKNHEGRYVVSNWPGSLEFEIIDSTVSKYNLGGKRIDFWFKFEGAIWHGYQIGDWDQIAHCKRNK